MPGAGRRGAVAGSAGVCRPSPLQCTIKVGRGRERERERERGRQTDRERERD